jgi:uncharacterized protein involved in exopolysaccharide biosynthesis
VRSSNQVIREPAESVRGNGQPAQTEEEILELETRQQFVGIARVLWENRRFLFRVAVVTLLVSSIVVFLIPNRYEATAQVMPPQDSSSSKYMLLSAVMGGTAGLASSLLGMKSSSAVYVEMLKSKTTQEQLVNRFDLRKVYWVKTYQAACKKLGNNTDINEDSKSGVITVAVTDRDPKRAAAMAEAYVDELGTLAATLDTSAAHRERVFLEGRLKEVKQDLESAQKAFSRFASTNTTIDLKEQGIAMVTAAAQLQGELIAAQSQLRGLEQIYGDENVRVRAAKAKINELQSQLKTMAGSDADLSGDSRSLYPQIRQLPKLGVSYLDLVREVKTQEAVYEVLVKQYELAKIEEAKEVPSIRILYHPRVPEKKSFPPRTAMILGFTLLSLVLGGFWVEGRQRWVQQDATNPAKMLAGEVLNDVQRMREQGIRKTLARGIGLRR